MTPVLIALLAAAVAAAVPARAQDLGLHEPGVAARAVMQGFAAPMRSQAETMDAELEAVLGDMALSPEARVEAADAVIERHRPQIEALATALGADMRAAADLPANVAEREQLLAYAELAPAHFRRLPDELREWVRTRVYPLPPPRPPVAVAPYR